MYMYLCLYLYLYFVLHYAAVECVVECWQWWAGRGICILYLYLYMYLYWSLYLYLYFVLHYTAVECVVECWQWWAGRGICPRWANSPLRMYIQYTFSFSDKFFVFNPYIQSFSSSFISASSSWHFLLPRANAPATADLQFVHMNKFFLLLSAIYLSSNFFSSCHFYFLELTSHCRLDLIYSFYFISLTFLWQKKTILGTFDHKLTITASKNVASRDDIIKSCGVYSTQSKVQGHFTPWHPDNVWQTNIYSRSQCVIYIVYIVYQFSQSKHLKGRIEVSK